MIIDSQKWNEEVKNGIWRLRNGSWYRKVLRVKWERYVSRECSYCKSKFTTKHENQCCSKRCGRKIYWQNIPFGETIGQGVRTQHGYRHISINGKSIAEHRYVMEKIVGRKLKRSEHVHHINGMRGDNRPENLMLVSIGDHNTFHKPKQCKNWSRDKNGKFH